MTKIDRARSTYWCFLSRLFRLGVVGIIAAAKLFDHRGVDFRKDVVRNENLVAIEDFEASFIRGVKSGTLCEALDTTGAGLKKLLSARKYD
jgi:hypothetical protein